MPTPPIAVVIGASAGAIEALSQILPTLPRDFRLPIMVVVHIPPDRESIIADLFRRKCAVPVHEAEDKELISAGTIYFAPPDYHLLVEEDRILSLSSEEPVNYSRPSIDLLFETAADAYGSELLGIMLTGANNDGAAGCRRIGACGGKVLVQQPSEAQVNTMPLAALAACPDARALTLNEIASYLREIGKAE
ncbi:chemotaxis protein CheB [Anatilimnocola sp. NA78]|uniref:chemotaxis protein CheB n=1 Tax=Anatilimnocola sp. NA78 TaxID=3415683 RepID=UPI003CE4A718